MQKDETDPNDGATADDGDAAFSEDDEVLEVLMVHVDEDGDGEGPADTDVAGEDEGVGIGGDERGASIPAVALGPLPVTDTEDRFDVLAAIEGLALLAMGILPLLRRQSGGSARRRQRALIRFVALLSAAIGLSLIAGARRKRSAVAVLGAASAAAMTARSLTQPTRSRKGSLVPLVLAAGWALRGARSALGGSHALRT